MELSGEEPPAIATLAPSPADAAACARAPPRAGLAPLEAAFPRPFDALPDCWLSAVLLRAPAPARLLLRGVCRCWRSLLRSPDVWADASLLPQHCGGVAPSDELLDALVAAAAGGLRSLTLSCDIFSHSSPIVHTRPSIGAVQQAVAVSPGFRTLQLVCSDDEDGNGDL